MKPLDRFLWGLLVALGLSIPAAPSHAGCGCDHPPPAFAPVMPAFGSPGSELVLNLEAPSLEEGATYWVSFTNEKSPIPAYGEGVARAADSLRLTVPSTILTGPARIQIHDEDRSVIAEFDDSLFTGLPLPRRMPAGDAMILIEDFYAAVSRDGVLYIPVDLSDVLDPTQFAFVMPNDPVVFTPEQVVFYNRHGVDLTLFTLAVDDPTVRQWGSYYGWDVDEDGGIVGTVYDLKVGESPAEHEASDMLTYWRHEFHTYAEAHARGGSHKVDAEGYHKDGTWHVDHDSLVIAIRGGLDGAPLRAPHLVTDLLVTMVRSDGPIEPEEMAQKAYGSEVYVVEDAALTGYVAGLMGEETTTVGDAVVVEESTTTELEAVADAEEPAPVVDVQIAKAAYNDDKERLVVYATVGEEHGGDLELTVSVQGFVSNAPMAWNESKARYQYKASSSDDLDDRLAVVSHSSGASASQVIR